VSFFFLSQLWLHGVSGLIQMSTPLAIVTAASLIIFVFGVAQEVFGFLSLTKIFGLLFAYFAAAIGLAIQGGAEVLYLGLHAQMMPMWAAYVCSVLMLVYPVFAFNTANGSDGLVPSLCIFTIMGLLPLNLGAISYLLSLVAIGCVIFMMFNITVGRIYIGSGGTYFLGTLLGFTFLYAQTLPNVDVAYVLCLFFYPNANLLYSLIRRRLKGKALFGDDNGHLHNLIYRRLSSIPLFGRQSNTLTGLSVAFTFACLPMLLGRSELAVNWWVVYGVMWLGYVFLYRLFNITDLRELHFA